MVTDKPFTIGSEDLICPPALMTVCLWRCVGRLLNCTITLTAALAFRPARSGETFCACPATELATSTARTKALVYRRKSLLGTDRVSKCLAVVISRYALRVRTTGSYRSAAGSFCSCREVRTDWKQV